MNTVKVMIRAKLDGKYPYVPAVVNSNGRIKPGVALVGGIEQKVEGSYYLRFTEDGQRRFGWVGDDAAEAITAARKMEVTLRAKALGVAVKSSLPETPSERIKLADAIAEYNPHRPRPTDLNGLTTNLRRRGDRWYWHWDPQFISGTAAFPPFEVTEAERMHAAIETILRGGVPMLLIRGQMSDLVSQERADEFLERFPQIEFADVRGAGHMVAGDRNDIFAGAVLDFLTRHIDAG